MAAWRASPSRRSITRADGHGRRSSSTPITMVGKTSSMPMGRGPRRRVGVQRVPHNDGAGQFSQKQFSAGLANDFNLFSFALIDYDRDGGISTSSATAPRARSRSTRTARRTATTASRFQLDPAERQPARDQRQDPDHRRPGTRPDPRDQGGRRLLQNFTTPPKAYFGLGTATAIEELTLVTPEGERITEKLHLPAGSLAATCSSPRRRPK